MKGLSDVEGVRVVGPIDVEDSVWHLFVIEHERRDELREQLARAGIQTLVHYPITPHRSGAYAALAGSRFPVAESLAARVLSIPMYPQLSTGALEHVALCIHRATGAPSGPEADPFGGVA